MGLSGKSGGPIFYGRNMPFHVSPHIRYCVVNNRAALLNLQTDRYFCLAPALDAEFQRLMNGGLTAGDDNESVSDLVEAGILTAEPSEVVRSASWLRPTSDAPVVDHKRANLAEMAIATFCYYLAKWDVKSRPIARIVSSIENGRTHTLGAQSSAPCDLTLHYATLFSQIRFFVRAQDKCLIWSLAMIKFLAAHRLPANLLIGVKLEPFGAHAWVQSGPRVLSCPLEEALQYTPILVA